MRLRAAVLLLLALVAFSAPVHSAPVAPISDVTLNVVSVSFAPLAAHGSDTAQNDGVIGRSRQIEAIRRMSVSVPVRALVRSDATHMGLITQNDKNTAVSAAKMMVPVRSAGSAERETTRIAVRAPPAVIL